jgi:hypothetical protein
MNSSVLRHSPARSIKIVAVVGLAAVSGMLAGCAKEESVSEIDIARLTAPPTVPPGVTGSSGSSGDSGPSGAAAEEFPTTTVFKSGPSAAPVEAAPKGVTLAESGDRSVKIDKAAVAPTEPQTWVAKAGSGECTVEKGDTAAVEFQMVSWSGGNVVDQSAADMPLSIPLNLEENPLLPPVALRSALIGNTVGTRIGVLFPAGLADLPAQFPSESAYVLAVDLVGSEKCGE